MRKHPPRKTPPQRLSLCCLAVLFLMFSLSACSTLSAPVSPPRALLVPPSELMKKSTPLPQLRAPSAGEIWPATTKK